MDSKKTKVHYVGGPKDGAVEVWGDAIVTRIVFPKLGGGGEEYVRVGRLDGDGREVYEYSGPVADIFSNWPE